MEWGGVYRHLPPLWFKIGTKAIHHCSRVFSLDSPAEQCVISDTLLG